MGNSFNVNFNFSELEKEIQNLAGIEAKVNKSIENLAKGAFNQAIAIAKQKLHATYQMFLDNWHLEIDSTGRFTAYILILKEKAVFVDDGHPELKLKETHLNGKDSVIIPFTHKKEGMLSSTMSQQQQNLYQEIKQSMSKNKIPLQNPIKDKFGAAILSTSAKPRAAAMIASVASQKVGSQSGESVLNRLHIYQHQNKSTGQINKTMMTFRTMSKDGKASWIVPARESRHILDQTYQWILDNYTKFLDQAIANMKVTI